MLISILTGLLAGSLHVIGGADHLVGITPMVLRQPRLALRAGMAWGLGHSGGVVFLALVAIFLKDFTDLHLMSFMAEFVVGITLLMAGFITIKKSLGLNIHTHEHVHRDGSTHTHMHLHFMGQRKHLRHTHAATSLGLLHGVAGAGHLLAVLPAFALPTFGAFAYVAAYLLGSVVAMGVVVIAISFATMKVGKKALPFLFGFTGWVSVFTGFFWIYRTSGMIF